MLRLVESYEQRKASEYADLFTGDFTFEFSNSTDPDLVNKYLMGWFKTDEDTAAKHLFLGFAPQGQPTFPAASSINIDMTTTQPVDDNNGVDPVTHKVNPTRVDGQITIPPSPPETDPTPFLIEDNYNAFYLIRGDQAVGLSASQPADSAHWYIYRWVDLTTSSAPPRMMVSSPMPSQPATWGKVKGLYR